MPEPRPLADVNASENGQGTDRRQHRPVVAAGPSPRSDAAQYVARHRLEPFHRALYGLAIAVFGDEATVVPHMRTIGGRRRLTFVVDAADPAAGVDYEQFVPRERAFWTAYAHVPKPEIPFIVAIRPARGWCRVEALAPLFALMPTADMDT
jgi:hypothetical protein